jgi:hypothetical protein
MPTFHRPHQTPLAQKALHSVRTINARPVTTSKTPGTGTTGTGNLNGHRGHIVGHSGSPCSQWPAGTSEMGTYRRSGS